MIYELFIQCWNNYYNDFEELNKDYCYSFTLQHPNNRIVIPIIEKKIYLTNIFKCINDDTSNIVKHIEFNSKENVISFEDTKIEKNIPIPKNIYLKNKNVSYDFGMD